MDRGVVGHGPALRFGGTQAFDHRPFSPGCSANVSDDGDLSPYSTARPTNILSCALNSRKTVSISV